MTFNSGKAQRGLGEMREGGANALNVYLLYLLKYGLPLSFSNLRNNEKFNAGVVIIPIGSPSMYFS